MKKYFRKLTKSGQRKMELAYHHMNPSDFDELMSKAKKCAPTAVRLPGEMIKALKVVAELEGERGYQSMIRRWIEERLRHEAKLARRLSKMPVKKVAAVLRSRSSS